MEVYKNIFRLCFSMFTDAFFGSDFFQAGLWICLIAVPFIMASVMIKEMKT